MINRGISLGLLPGIPVWLLVLILIFLIVYALKMRELWERVGVVLVIIGGILNLTSRILYGGVVDNLVLFGLVYNNFADYLIFFGVVIYGYTYFVRR